MKREDIERMIKEAYAVKLARYAMRKHAKKNPNLGPDLPDVAEAPSAKPVDPPKAPKAFKPENIKFGPQTFSGTHSGTLAKKG